MKRVGWLVVVVVMAVGCSKSKDRAPDEAKADDETKPETTEQTSAPPPCPAPGELERQLAGLWKIGAEQRVELIGCVPGTYPEPGWFVMGWVDTGDDEDFRDESQLRQDIVASGRLITTNPPSDVAPQERNEGLTYTDFAAHDFDGDGAHEIVFHEHLEYREVMSTHYNVLRRRGGTLEQALTVPIEREVSNEAWIDDEEGEEVASVSCEAEVAIDGKAVVVTGKVTIEGNAKELAVDAEGCVDGSKRFELVDGKFTAK